MEQPRVGEGPSVVCLVSNDELELGRIKLRQAFGFDDTLPHRNGSFVSTDLAS